MTFVDAVCAKYGMKWCVAGRLTNRLKLKGYEVAINPKVYSRMYHEWEAANA